MRLPNSTHKLAPSTIRNPFTLNHILSDVILFLPRHAPSAGLVSVSRARRLYSYLLKE